MIDFIDLDIFRYYTGHTEPTQENGAAFSVSDLPRYTNSLGMTSSLPHGSHWRPRTAKDRDKLIRTLQAIHYPKATEPVKTFTLVSLSPDGKPLGEESHPTQEEAIRVASIAAAYDDHRHWFLVLDPTGQEVFHARGERKDDK